MKIIKNPNCKDEVIVSIEFLIDLIEHKIISLKVEQTVHKINCSIQIETLNNLLNHYNALQ
jgi:hypothetical protein